MNHLLLAFGVFACVCGSALSGMYLRVLLPEHHLSDESSSAIKLAIGLVATIAALVLGLLISSAKGSFDTINNDLIHNAANIIRLDSVLSQYGPQTRELRGSLKRNYASWIDLLDSSDTARAARLNSPEIIGRVEQFEQRIAELQPTDEAQRESRARALRVADDVFTARSLALLQRAGSLPLPLLIVLVCWLSIIFGTFGLLAPRNGAIVVAYLLCAFCAAGAIFLILEMDTPLDGIIKVPTGPMRDALARLDR
ncbi:bestrophin-like domain [Paraburkholderia sediminicola]|uniref:bestrophin-like domain n=1 Tax=Paraburkholderia sediminicola TaxID=458836 RepID=UPI0038BBC298